MNEKGASLLLVLLLIVILTFLGTTLVFIVSKNTKMAGYEKRHKEAFFIAEAGVRHAMKILERDFAISSIGSFDELLSTASQSWVEVNGYGEEEEGGGWFLIPSLSQFEFQGGIYKVYIRDDVDEDPSDPYDDSNNLILMRSTAFGPGGGKTTIEVELAIVQR